MCAAWKERRGGKINPDRCFILFKRRARPETWKSVTSKFDSQTIKNIMGCYNNQWIGTYIYINNIVIIACNKYKLKYGFNDFIVE